MTAPAPIPQFKLGNLTAWSNVVRLGVHDETWYAAIGATVADGYCSFAATPAEALVRLARAIDRGVYVLDASVTTDDLALIIAKERI